jgi:hypothetical protein
MASICAGRGPASAPEDVSTPAALSDVVVVAAGSELGGALASAGGTIMTGRRVPGSGWATERGEHAADLAGGGNLAVAGALGRVPLGR